MEIISLILNILLLLALGGNLFIYAVKFLHDWLKKPTFNQVFKRITDDLFFLKDLLPNQSWIYVNEKTNKKYKITVNVEEIEEP